MDPAVFAAIAQGLGGLLGNMGKGSAGSTGYDTVNFNDPYDAASRANSTAYLQDMLASLRAGKAPDWLNRYGDQQQAYLLNQNKNQFFGKEGQSGGSIADAASSAGAMQGVGGAAGTAPVNKALSDYADRMNGINQYIATLKNNYMTQASQTVPGQLYQMGQRDNRIIPINHPGSNPDPLMQGIGQALGSVDYSKLFSGGSKTTPQQQAQTAPASQYGSYTPAIPQQVAQQQSYPLSNSFPMTMGSSQYSPSSAAATSFLRGY